jgi:hypothetical protein
VKLLEKGAVGAALQFHDPASMGSLNLALLMEYRTVGTSGAYKRVAMATFAIETAFGLWVPSAYVDRVKDRIEASAKLRRLELMKQGRKLDAASDDLLTNRIGIYLNAINMRLPRASRLTDPYSLKRLSRPLIGVPVPEFWEDEQSGKELFETYTEYLAYKLIAVIGYEAAAVDNLSFG